MIPRSSAFGEPHRLLELHLTTLKPSHDVFAEPSRGGSGSHDGSTGRSPGSGSRGSSGGPPRGVYGEPNRGNSPGDNLRSRGTFGGIWHQPSRFSLRDSPFSSAARVNYSQRIRSEMSYH